MKTQIFRRLSLLIILCCVSLYAQFIDAKIVLDTDRLRKSLNNELDNFETTIQNYLLSTEFAPDAMDIEFSIELHFFLEEISDKGNEKIFSAQILAHNGLDQQYFTKGVEFSYYPGKNMIYNVQFESLRSIIDYYAFLIISGDLDTYDLMGGETYYKKTEEIALEGKSSSSPRGWDERRRKSRNLQKNYALRTAKLQFYLAIDMYQNPETKVAALQKILLEFYNSILDVDAIIGKDKDTQIFLKAHGNEIGVMMQRIKLFDELRGIIEYDQDSSEILSKYLPKSDKTE